MRVCWLADLKAGHIALDSSLYEDFANPEFLKVHFGSIDIDMKVLVRKDLSTAILGLPIGLSTKYTVPADIPYDCFVNNRGVHIGPVIAYVVQGKFEQLNKKTLAKFLPRFFEYERVRGLIFVCTADTIDLDQLMIDGYYFDPRGLISGNPWNYGRFPLPNALFNRSFLSQQKIRLLRKKIGNTIFNSYWYALNKFKIFKLLSQNEDLREHLPYTEKFCDVNQLHRLLDNYESLYIKPVNLSRGRGIMKVTKAPSGLLVADEKSRRYSLTDEEAARRFFKEKVKRQAIVQAGVPFTLGGQCLDFRLYLQRNERREWTFQGLVSRTSLKGGIITNLQGRAEMLPGREALLKIYRLNEETAAKVEKTMVTIVEKAVSEYEKRGLLIGDVAADIILDANLKLWLLELQLNYAADRLPDLLPSEIFYRIMTTPFKYAKSLAGF